MISKRYVGKTLEAYTFVLATTVSGLTDVELEVTKPDGTNIAPNIDFIERGSSKEYDAVFIPPVAGTYVITVVSPTHTTVNGHKGAIAITDTSIDDVGGAGYDSALHSLKLQSDKLDTIISGQGTADEGLI